MSQTQEWEASNAVRLTGRQWIGVGLFAVVLFFGAPRLWSRWEKLEFEPDYRVPHSLGSDYWIYRRWTQIAASNCDVMVIGDSAIWGPYVTRDQTLSAHLNRLAGRQRFANLAVEGMHPAALAGLVEFHGAAYAGKKVVLQWNPLWLSDPRLDLRETEFDFNHPQLVPQFSPKIPCLKEDTSHRIGNSLERGVDFCDWTNHLQTAYFEAKSIPLWTIDHPRENPLKPVVMLRLPPSDDRPEEGKAVSWAEKRMPRRDFEWVDLETSIQWRSFRRIVETLERRGCVVFVLLGPFNEPMLKDGSLEAYVKIRGAAESWLKARNTSFWTAPPLPSEMYADASHPLSAGYLHLARQLAPQAFFK